MSSDSLKKRYFAKLAANFVSAAAGLGVQMLAPRGLGPKAYGDFSFLNSAFLQISSFFDMGSSTCFYTELSKKPKEFSLIVFYFWFTVAASAGLLIFAGFSFISKDIFPEQTPFYVYMAAGLAAITAGAKVLQQVADARALTVKAEAVRMFLAVAGLAVLGGLFLWGKLTLLTFFLYNQAALLFLGIGFALVILRSGVYRGESWRLKKEELLNHTRAFVKYCHPLMAYTLTGAAAVWLDRWLLQIFGGSVQQGFFGLSSQIGAVCLIFTSAMTPLLIREFSINHGAGAADKTAALFRRHIPLLYTVSVYFAAFVAVESDKAALILGGDKFAGASAAVMIMALYPAHQTCGQLSGSYFLASGKTALYRNIGIFVLLMGLPMTYFAVAPARLLGFDGGAAGLAVKNVLQNIISVNILIFFICRELRLRFSWFLINQALCMGVFLCLALGARGLTAILLNGAGALSAFFCSGVIYTGLAAAFCALFPHIAGISREELFAELSSALKHIRSGNG